MKKVLIIQKDEAYFLSETFQLIERHWNSFKHVELHFLIQEKAWEKLNKYDSPLFSNIHFNSQTISEIVFETSFNLSMDEVSWNEHSLIKSQIRSGPYIHNGQLIVKDLWSSHLLTLKAKAPFLAIHLQDIYRNILGLSYSSLPPRGTQAISRIVYAPFSVNYFPATEQEKFITEMTRAFSNIPIVDISEIDFTEDLLGTLYIGPLSLEAAKLSTNGAKSVFLQSTFSGFNLIPYTQDNIIISSMGKKFDSKNLSGILEGAFKGKYKSDIPYAVYTVDSETSSNLFLKSHNKTDPAYPIYKSHFILWNFILSLEDVDLSLEQLSTEQRMTLSENLHALKKITAMQEFALSATNTILKQAKAKLVDLKKLEENTLVIKDYDETANNLANSHPYLRPFLDFYRIRKGQTTAFTLQEQAEESLLIYHEEQQVLMALCELFSVTLNRNEVKI